MRKVFRILNKDGLPTRGGLISWGRIQKGFLFKTESELYGYNEFEFVRYDKEERRLYLKYKEEKCDILTGVFCDGGIGALLIKYASYKIDNFEIYNKLKMNEVGIVWSDIKSGEILRTNHKEYGDNKFEFLRYEKGKYNKLYLKYNGKEHCINSDKFIKGNIGGIIGEITREFKFEVGTRFNDNNRDLTIIDREYRQKQLKPDKKGKVYSQDMKFYKYKCNKCNWGNGVVEEGKLIGKKQGCSCCAGQTVVPGINDIRTTAPFMMNLGISKEDSVKYTKSSGSKVVVHCPDCGRKKKINIDRVYRNKSIGCSCGDGKSYISKYIQSLLDELCIEYEMEVKYNWNKYINPLNNKITQAYIDFVMYKDGREIPLEADGGFHRKDNKMTGGTKEMAEYVDKQRDENCLKYLGEHTIRICDEGDVKSNILNSKLSSIFDLNVVDWEECEKYAIKSNKVKEICEYWSNKEKHKTTKDLGEVFNLSKSTIISSLKKGNLLGWCSYDPKEEIKKSASKSGRITRKRVEIFKEGISLGIFESCHKLEGLSETTFGVKLFSPNISSVCNGKLHKYKGYTFKYVD